MRRFLTIAFGLLLLNSAFIAAFAQPTIFYMGNVVLHLALGLVLMGAAAMLVRRFPRESGAFLIAGLPAIYLVIRGNVLQHRWALAAHIAFAVLAALLICARLWNPRVAGAVALAALIPLSTAFLSRQDSTIRNPQSPPLSMDQEGGGANNPFAPSSAQSNDGKIIP